MTADQSTPFFEKVTWRLNRLRRQVSCAVVPVTQFAVVSSGRSGSSFLIDLLQSHPDITTCWEYFTDNRLKTENLSGKNLLLEFKQVMERERFERARGVKFLYYQLEPSYANQFSLPELIPVQQYVQSNRRFKIIHLIRKNRVRTAVSIKKAAATGIYHAMKLNVMEKSGAHKIEIDPEELLIQLQAMEVAEIDARARFGHHELLELTYEDLVRDRQVEMKKVAAFLGIRYQSVSSRLLKLSPKKLSDSVTNYEELKNALFETRWGEYLDE